jgi:hypothetical protein
MTSLGHALTAVVLVLVLGFHVFRWEGGIGRAVHAFRATFPCRRPPAGKYSRRLLLADGRARP